jgi:hypothetical protein
MTEGLADHVGTMHEWITFPSVQLREDTTNSSPAEKL